MLFKYQNLNFQMNEFKRMTLNIIWIIYIHDFVWLSRHALETEVSFFKITSNKKFYNGFIFYV